MAAAAKYQKGLFTISCRALLSRMAGHSTRATPAMSHRKQAGARYISPSTALSRSNSAKQAQQKQLSKASSVQEAGWHKVHQPLDCTQQTQLSKASSVQEAGWHKVHQPLDCSQQKQLSKASSVQKQLSKASSVQGAGRGQIHQPLRLHSATTAQQGTGLVPDLHSEHGIRWRNITEYGKVWMSMLQHGLELL